MRVYKRLAGATVSSLLTFLIAFISSLMLEKGLDWFVLLKQPYFSLSSGGYSLLHMLAYSFNIFAVAELIVSHRFLRYLPLLAGVWLCAISFVGLFFVGKNIVAGFTAMLFVLGFSYVLLTKLLIDDLTSGLLFLPVVAVFSYLFVTCSAIMSLN